MRVLSDNDVDLVPKAVFAVAISAFVIEDFEGRTTAPPRVAVDFPTGKLVFTTGGSENLAGFRAYETFQSKARSDENQIVVVWDTKSCALKGACFGVRLGALRTGVLGGLAVKLLRLEKLVPAPLSEPDCRPKLSC